MGRRRRKGRRVIHRNERRVVSKIDFFSARRRREILLFDHLFRSLSFVLSLLSMEVKLTFIISNLAAWFIFLFETGRARTNDEERRGYDYPKKRGGRAREMVVVVPDSNNAHAKKCPYHHHRTTRAKNTEDNDITITNNDGKQDKQNSTEDERPRIGR